MYIYIYIHINIYIYIHLYIYVCICICIHKMHVPDFLHISSHCHFSWKIERTVTLSSAVGGVVALIELTVEKFKKLRYMSRAC